MKGYKTCEVIAYVTYNYYIYLPVNEFMTKANYLNMLKKDNSYLLKIMPYWQLFPLFGKKNFQIF